MLRVVVSVKVNVLKRRIDALKLKAVQWQVARKELFAVKSIIKLKGRRCKMETYVKNYNIKTLK